MAVGQAELSVELQAAPGADAEEQAPEESKGAGWLAAGELAVRLVTSPEVLAAVIAGIRSWLGRNSARSVKLTLGGDALEVSGVSSAEQDRLIELWVARHATGP